MRTFTRNHKSALQKAKLVKEKIEEEVIMGNYVVTRDPPLVISALGAVPKDDSSIRLIHDFSLPVGNSVNDLAYEMEKQRFQTVDHATRIMKQGCYMAKVDLKSAYRSVSISKHSQQFTGLQWGTGANMLYMYDTKLPFGAKLAPACFHRLTQAVKRMLNRVGIKCVIYLDDILLLCENKEDCVNALELTIRLLRNLGFQINWNKVVDPTQCLTFLGVELDSQEMCARLPAKKLQELKQELAAFGRRKRANKRQLQSLAGKLNWAAMVIIGGRVYLRGILNTINSMKRATDRTRLPPELVEDIVWWQSCMNHFNGKSIIRDERAIETLYTDASVEGAGAFYNNDWVYLNWSRDMPIWSDLHINMKEILAVVIGCLRWAACWENKTIYVMTDNTVTVSVINRGTCRDPVVMPWLRIMFWLSVTFNFLLKATHIPGIKNDTADSISRLHEQGQPGRLLSLLQGQGYDPLYNHMSLQGVDFLFQVHASRRGQHGSKNWTS